MKETWDKFIEFLKTYDLNKIVELLRKLDWQELLLSPWLWAAAVLLSGFVIWKRRLSLLILAVSFCAFVWLLQDTLPESGKSIPLNKMLQFIGGAVVLLGINLYFFFIREK